MARGWESKSVESQIESTESRAKHAAPPRLTPEQQQMEQERESLRLTRIRVLHDLESAANPRYRAQLEASLVHLDSRLAALGGSGLP